MIRLPRFLLLLSLTAPTALGQDALPAPQPSTSPAAPTPGLPTAPEASAPVDPPASKPPVAGDRVPDADLNPDLERLPDPFETPPSSPILAETKPPKESDVREFKIVYLKNAAAQTVQSIVYDIFGADVTPGVDPRTNSLILSGPAAKLNEVMDLVEALETAEPAPPAIQELRKRASSDMAPRELKMGPAERRVGELLEERQLRLGRDTGKAEVDEKHLEPLREAIAAAFDERQAQQLAEIEELSTRLQELSKTVRGRQAKRQQMIERRLSDLLKSESPEPNELLQPRTLESSFRGVRTEEDLFNRNPVILFFGAGDDEDSIGQIALMHRLQGQGHPVELIDIRDNPRLAARFEIQQIPTVIAVRDGAERARIVGPTTFQNLYSDIVKATDEDPNEAGTERSSSTLDPNTSTESLFQSVMRLSSRAAVIKADLNGETGELRNRPKDDPRAIEVREQLNVGLAQIRAQAAEYQKFVASAADLAKTRLENAKSDLDRHRQLFEQGIVPVSELRKSEEALAEAEAAFKQVTQIQEVLSSITAPAEDAKVETIEN